MADASSVAMTPPPTIVICSGKVECLRTNPSFHNQSYQHPQWVARMVNFQSLIQYHWHEVRGH